MLVSSGVVLEDSQSYSSASEEVREHAPWEGPDRLLRNWKDLVDRHNKDAEKMISGDPLGPIKAGEFCEIFAKVRRESGQPSHNFCV